MSSSYSTLLVALLALLAVAHAADLRAQLSPVPQREAGAPWVMRFTLANDHTSPLSVLTRYTPLAGFHSRLPGLKVVDVTDAEAPTELRYIGMHAKLGRTLVPDEFVTIAPSATLSATLDLSKAYHFEAGHRYQVTFDSLSVRFVGASTNGAPRSLEPAQLEEATTAPLQAPFAFEVTKSSVLPWEQMPKPAASEVHARQATQRVGSFTYISCDNSERATTDSALETLQPAAQAGATYVENGCVGGPDDGPFLRFFGVASQARQSRVRDQSTNVHNIVRNGGFGVDCSRSGCPSSNTYAYVFPADPTHVVYLCDVYFRVSNSLQIDSQPGTLHHEFTHFDDIGDTLDHAYGVTDCEALALSDPDTAVDNADSNEYYIESAPSCAAVCFHEDTTFTYKGRTLTREQMEQEPECHVLHQKLMGGKGVKITTACGQSLRLTVDHLVFTPSGDAVRAGDVQAGHQVMTENGACDVTSVHASDGPWFGVQCLEGEVYANGIHASVFAHYHTIPAFYLRWVGWAIGVKPAAQVGQVVTQSLRYIGVL